MNEPIPGLIRKQVEGGVKKMAQAQAADLSAIHKYAPPGAEIAAEDVLVVNALLAHTRVDRSHEKFSKAYLDRFAETLPGKSFLIGHNYDLKPDGRWIDAEVRAVGADYELHTKFYVKAKSDLAEDLRLGIAKDVSIGFVPDQLLCDLCGKDFNLGYRSADGCQHERGQAYDGEQCTLTYSGDTQRVEALEGSLVWLGCQPGAQITGNAAPANVRTKAFALAALGDSMELKEALAEIERLKPLAEAGAKHEKAAVAYEASLRKEIARKTLTKEMAATRDQKAAEGATAFVSKMIVHADIEQLEALNADLDEHLKSVLAVNGKAEGAGHVPETKDSERVAPKRQAWEPRQRGAF